jgi:hypothetical protein
MLSSATRTPHLLSNLAILLLAAVTIATPIETDPCGRADTSGTYQARCAGGFWSPAVVEGSSDW